MWTDGNGFFYEGDCRVGDRAATDAEVAQWKATNAPPVTVPFLQFMALFTAAEQAAIVSSTDVAVKLFLIEASGAGDINLADPRVKSGLDRLTALGLLAAGRGAQIMAGAA